MRLPDVPVVAICGDGGFMFTATEMATAMRHRIPLVTVVFNDGAYGNVRRIQQERFGNRLIGSDLANPDFVAFGKSFGAEAVRAHEPAGTAPGAAARLRPPRRPDPDRGAGRRAAEPMGVHHMGIRGETQRAGAPDLAMRVMPCHAPRQLEQHLPRA